MSNSGNHETERIMIDEWNNLQSKMYGIWYKMFKIKESATKKCLDDPSFTKVELRRELLAVYDEFHWMIRDFFKETLPKHRLSLLVLCIMELCFVVDQLDKMSFESNLEPNFKLARPLVILEEVAQALNL